MSISKISSSKLPLSFYQDDDVIHIAQSLIGKTLVSYIDNKLTGGIISETEAYAGINDKASHAYGGRRTHRTEIMYAEGGVSYVYFNYGMHYLFNIVTSKKGNPNAVLIRGVIPTIGIETQIHRRGKSYPLSSLTNGPAKVSQALGITLIHNGISLLGDTVWIDGIQNEERKIISGPRVGVAYAEGDALLPFRFILDDVRYKPVKHR